MTLYRCLNTPVSSVTLRTGPDLTQDVVLHPGALVELPADNAWVQSSVRKGLLTPVLTPPPVIEPAAPPDRKPIPGKAR